MRGACLLFFIADGTLQSMQPVLGPLPSGPRTRLTKDIGMGPSKSSRKELFLPRFLFTWIFLFTSDTSRAAELISEGHLRRLGSRLEMGEIDWGHGQWADARRYHQALALQVEWEDHLAWISSEEGFRLSLIHI